ncbi:MAG: TIGR03960 family B12-binding radical SAM protein [Polyangiaceae bacterium]|nr:TIGR03960 family B12-binding radical SAM protein [Polyangiaceae bacterium]MCW5789881.1 TIGR03960 family B12-binding radical SAM protein [Polyangiaceae bacterium]
MQLFDHPYAAFLHRVEKPNRYTGAEHGARKKAWGDVEARVCLAFPEIYDIGMSHLGFRILYKILNDDPRTLAERCYAPWVDLDRELMAHGQLLVSLESARPLCDFDVVGFSLQYELTYTNILRMLDLGGIPLRAARRGDDDPLVVVGGPVATHMEPLAPFVDAVVIGDGEELTTELSLAWAAGRREGLSREERLQRLAAIPGVYVPSLYHTEICADNGLEVVTSPTVPGLPFPIERRLVNDLSSFPFPSEGPVGGPEAIFDRMSIEVARGCTEGCRFCQAGMIYRPVRERDPEQVIETVMAALERSGQDQVSLTALSTADVSCISPLIKKLVEKTAPERVSLSVASLRAYGLADDLLDDMRKVRASGLTFAPEAGTQRMRDVINKNVTEEQLLETAERTFSKGFDKMKLYFMIGLPTEEDDDVLGIVQVGRGALQVGKRLARGRASVTVSVSTHVPKPHTPFQWCAMDPLEEVARKQRLLRGAIGRERQLALRTHDATSSVLECVMARGDRRLGDVIEYAYLHGARFDSWDTQLKMDVWEAAFEHFQVDTERYIGTLPVGARLPWDHIDVGLEEGFLEGEYRKALRSRLSPPCGKAAGMFIHHTNVEEATADARRLVCYDCGVACDMSRMRSQRVGFLSRLGAERAGQRASLPVWVAPEGKAGKAANDAVSEDDQTGEGVSEAAKPRAAARSQRQDPEALRPVRAGGAPVRYRLRFTKTGPAALLGHLDLGRELARCLKRAGLRVAYSTGFSPKPELSYGPALSLGVPTLDEYLDLKLIDAPEPGVMIERLNRAAGGGLTFLEVARLGPEDPGLSKVITHARYVIALSRGALQSLRGVQPGTEPLGRIQSARVFGSAPDDDAATRGDAGDAEGAEESRVALEGAEEPRGVAALEGTEEQRGVVALEGAEEPRGVAALEQRIAAFNQAESVVITRRIKGLGKRVDVRRLTQDLRLGGVEERRALAAAGFIGDVVPLSVCVSISSAGSAKAAEIVEALTGDPTFPHQAVRERLLANGTSPLDLTAHKKPVTPPSEPKQPSATATA